MSEIMLVRHGETAWNAEEIFRGRIDIELSETGLRQAELLAGYLRDSKIEAVYSSPLKRAQRTAQTIGDSHGLEVIVTPRLLDLDFSEWQGQSVTEVRGKYPELYEEWLSSPHKFRIPAGESLDEVRERAELVIDEVIASRRSVVVLVSHRVVNKVLICALLGLDNSHFWNIRQDTCAITTFSHREGRFILTGHNDTSFLRPLAESPLADF